MLLAFLLIPLQACGGEDGTVAVAGSSAQTPPVEATPTPSPTPTPVPTPTPTATPTGGSSAPVVTPQLKTSFFVGNDPNSVTTVTKWFGRKPDAIQLFAGRASWDDWLGSVGWEAGIFASTGVDIMWSLPLIPTNATLEQASAGAYDSYYRTQARNLVQITPAGKKIYVRLGWEFNGDWQPWSAIGRPQTYQQAFRKVVTVFRAESDRFTFEWTPNVGGTMDPSTAYPGDAYVDVIGMDFYYDTQWYSSDPEKAWNTMVQQSWGLAWHQKFAADHGKPTAYAEWGVNSDTAGPYIKHAADWFTSHKVLYHSYWDSNADFKGMLSNGQYPHAAAAFKESFSN